MLGAQQVPWLLIAHFDVLSDLSVHMQAKMESTSFTPYFPLRKLKVYCFTAEDSNHVITLIAKCKLCADLIRLLWGDVLRTIILNNHAPLWYDLIACRPENCFTRKKCEC